MSGNWSGEWQLLNPVYRLFCESDHLRPIGLHFGTREERDTVENLKRKSDTKIRVIFSNLGVWKIHKTRKAQRKLRCITYWVNLLKSSTATA